jgi:hypothetical protein
MSHETPTNDALVISKHILEHRILRVSLAFAWPAADERQIELFIINVKPARQKGGTNKNSPP